MPDGLSLFLGACCRCWSILQDEKTIEQLLSRDKLVGFAVAAREGYDSVQFLAHPDQRCSGHADTAARGVPTAHEIVDVRPGASGQYACGVKDAKKTRYTSGWGGTQPCSCSNDFACSNCRRIRKRAYGELDPDELERALRWLETAVEDMELQLRGRRRVAVRDTLVRS